jgi:HEAT repeat protein
MQSAYGSARLLALAGVILLLPFAPRTEACDLGDGSSKFDRACQIIDCLTTNSPSIRPLAREISCGTFQPLRTPPPGQRPRVRELVNSLLTFVRTNDDLWLVDRVAFALASCEDEIWTPLFLDLLDHPSPQIRWRAIQHFAGVPSADARPVLEMLWEAETRDWVQADLLRSLARSGSRAALEDCERFVESGDTALSAASVDCLRLARPAGALESVLRVARGSGFCRRRQALAALAAWPESDEALEVLLEASSSNQMPGVAVAALTSFPQPEATERLLEVAVSTDLDTMVRFSAISAIADREHPEVVPMLQGILREPDLEESSLLKYSARELLISLGVQVPRSSAKHTSFTTTVSLECIDSDYGSWTVIPPPARSSIRCWASPHIAGNPEDHERIPAALSVEADDHFESEDSHWVHLGRLDCWAPVGVLESGSRPTVADEPSVFEAEFDAPVTELDSPMAAALLSAKLMSTFESDDVVTGVALDVDPFDRDAVALLVEMFEGEEGRVSDHVRDVLDELLPIYRDDREIARRLAAALEE